MPRPSIGSVRNLAPPVSSSRVEWPTNEKASVTGTQPSPGLTFAAPRSDMHSRLEMNPRLPPPDPNESLGMEPLTDTRLLAPTAVFALGTPSVQADRDSDSVLDLRPGLLIVVALG